MTLTPAQERALRSGYDALLAKHAGDGSDPLEEGLRHLTASRVLADHAAARRQEAVEAARHRGASWSDIGQIFGISRQGAQQRFGPPQITESTVRSSNPTRTVQTDYRGEMAVLEQAGNEGWRMIDHLPVGVVLEAVGGQWLHHRDEGGRPAPRVAGAEADGWTHIGNWYGLSYYFRSR